jgi:membrane-bound lytic murein transglycosylase D
VAWRRHFSGKGRRGLERWLEQAAPYAADVQRVLAEAGIPPELWTMTLLESGFEHRAQSPRRAAGPWQLVPGTARHLGLVMNADRDQRHDWEASTRAAAGYLNQLRDELGDGLLALAAFNCGPARVRKGSAGRKSASVWELDLPAETDKYVPRVLALAGLVGTAVSLDGARTPGPIAYETVALPRPVSVQDLARACDTEPAHIRRLNPAWLHAVSPGDGLPVEARVPPGSARAVKRALESGNLVESPAAAGREHRVQAGETLWGIARRYGVRFRDLLEANGLDEHSVLRTGSVLRLPAEGGRLPG